MGAFAPHGNTKRITARTTAVSAVKMTTTTDFLKSDSYILSNFGPATAFVGYGSNVNEAIANARVPADGDTTGTFCFIVPPGQRSIDALSKDTVHFAAVTISGTADIFITPGRGEIQGSLNSQVPVADLDSIFAYESGTEQELLRGILIELRTVTHFLKEGLNVAEDPDLIRGDQTNSIH